MALLRICMDSVLHEQVKSLAKKNNRSMIDEYRTAVKKHIAVSKKEELFEDSKIETLINKKFEQLDKHLAGMIAKNTIDTDTAMLGVIKLLYIINDGKTDIHSIQEELHKLAIEYFKTKKTIE